MLTKVDLVHSHHRPDYLIPALKNSRTVLSYHGVLDPSQVEQPYRMSKGRVHFAGISNSQISGVRNIGHWTVVHHGIDQSLYKPILHRPNPGYLVFLGRIWRPKGLHTAIEVAKATDSNLIIAGNIVQIRDNDNLFYYEHEILPQIDGKQIQYVGEVSDAEKDGLFKDARALLMPIEWEEPFGLAMVEAMACGTPVIAFNRGSAPEIVTNGQDGIICSSLQGMIEAVQHVTEIDRAVCRRTVETRFSVNAMLDRYEALYRGVVGAPA
jgi:glycosyltransferase involved in cell wall biosynthesis